MNDFLTAVGWTALDGLRHPRAVRWLAIMCVAILFGGQTVAQDRLVTFRGIEFDPLTLESADDAGMRDIGIEPRLQARDRVADDAAVWRMLEFSVPIDRDLRHKLRAAGLQLDKYVDGVYLERASVDALRPLEASGLLLASPRYHPAFKLMPSIRGDNIHAERVWLTDRQESFEGRWFQITVFPDVDAEEIARAMLVSGTETVLVHASKHPGGPDRIAFRLDTAGDALEQQIAEIAQIEGIESIEEVGEIITLNTNAAGVNQSGASTNPTLWNAGLTGAGQAISIFDNGIADENHCFFKDEEGVPVGGTHRKLLDIRNDPTLPPGPHDHATFVAGSAAGDDLDDSGSHTGRGGAWSAKLVLVNYKLFYLLHYMNSSGDSVSPPLSTILDELVNASNNANVHSNSWQDRDPGPNFPPFIPYSSYANDVDQFSRQFEDHLVVAAAGATFTDWGAPAIAKNTLSVSAAEMDASSIGEGYDDPLPSGRRKPDMAVVGCNIESSVAVVDTNDCPTVTAGCATSNAAPHAAALAALARQYFVDGWYQGSSYTPTGSLLKAILINSARDVPGAPGFPSLTEGWGVARLDQTLVFDDSETTLRVHDIRNDDAEALQTAESTDYTIPINHEDIPLKITLVWTDPPNGAGNDAVDNNLDLKVTAPDGETLYFGNYFSGGESQPGGLADSVNNVEQVLIKTPQEGHWSAQVIGAHIADVLDGEQGQGYALVITAGIGTSDPFSAWEIVAIILTILFIYMAMQKYKDWFKPPRKPEAPTSPQSAID